MPINRLTAFSVLAAVLFVIAPVQATTSKSHGKSVPAKHAQQVKHTHGKLAHHKPTQTKHGKLATATHKSTHSRSTASVARVADTTPATANAVASVEMESALPISGSLQASSRALDGFPVAANATPQLLNQLPIFNPAPMLSQSIVPASTQFLLRGNEVAVNGIAVQDIASAQVDGDEPATAVDGSESITDLRKALIAMAMKMRDIRYVRGGHDPSTGFDCSGFVRYVFAHAIGMQLPNNSASQFLAGLKVKRADMKPGDLVFFRTHGKRNISHVGIYISNGRFIHSPTSGKSVEISSLNEAYWAKRFAGAKRPEAMAMVANKG